MLKTYKSHHLRNLTSLFQLIYLSGYSDRQGRRKPDRERVYTLNPQSSSLLAPFKIEIAIA